MKDRAACHLSLHDLLCSLRSSKLSSLRGLIISLCGALDCARDGALDGARDGAREGALEGARVGACDGALPFDILDFAFDATSSWSSSCGAGSSLGARVSASEGSLCLSLSGR